MQLITAGLGAWVPQPFREVRVQTDGVAEPFGVYNLTHEFATIAVAA